MLNFFIFIIMIKRDKCRPNHNPKREEAAVTLCIITDVCHAFYRMGIFSFAKDCFLYFRVSALGLFIIHVVLLYAETYIVLLLVNLINLILVHSVN